MTWFRVGGAGIPASLKNNMNSVLNKKFGTTGQNYPPNGWPADVNLLGPLPEKTVAGAIAHTDDAADTVPVKSVICSIVPKQAGSGTPSPTNVRALSGYTGLTASQRSINMLDTAEAETKTNNSVSVTCDGAGKYTATGTATGGSANITFTLKTPIKIKSGMYFHAMNSVANGNASIALQKQDNSTIMYFSLSPTNRIVDLSSYAGETVYSIRFYVVNGASFEIILTPMICANSSTLTFETFNAVSDVSDSWSSIGAILGGERNLSDGTMSSYGYLYDLGSNNWVADPNRPGVFYSNVSASGRVAGSNVLGCDCFETRNISVSTSYDNYISGANSYGGAYIFIRCTDYANMTGQEVRAALTGKYVCLKSSNATSYSGLSTYDFETLYAVNNFYSDIEGGQTQVTYRQDIALALQAVSSSRGLMMASRPVTQLVGEESDLDQVNELNEEAENTEEQEGEDDAR